MILGTYANLDAIDEKQSGAEIDRTLVDLPAGPIPILLNQSPDSADHLPQHTLQMADNPIDKAVEQNIKEPNSNNKITSENLREDIPKVVRDPNTVREINLPDGKHVNSPKATVLITNPLENNILPDNKLPQPFVEVKEHRSAKSDSVINMDAIQKEDQEIAIADKENAGKELKQTQQLLEQVKDELEKQNKETQKFVLEKIEKISEKVDKIGKARVGGGLKETLSDKVKDNKFDIPQPAEPRGLPNTVVKLLLDSKQNITNSVNEVNGKAGENSQAVPPVNAAVSHSPGIDSVPPSIRPLPPIESPNQKKIDQLPLDSIKHDPHIQITEKANVEKFVAEKSIAESMHRDLLDVESPTGPLLQAREYPKSTNGEREKREIPVADPVHNLSQSNAIPKSTIAEDSMPNVMAPNQDATSNPGVLASFDQKIFVRDLKSVNDTAPTVVPINDRS